MPEHTSKPDRATLAATRVAAHDDTSRAIVLLHGIYGRGRNWQAIAQAIVAARPDYACWLVDLPYHGDSGPGVHGDTVRGLALDLRDWLEDTGLVPDVVLGHSYGGKVAMAYAEGERERPLQIWVIDSTPDAKPADGSAWRMLQVVRALPARLASRAEAQNAIMAAGFPVGVAQWMATNLVRDGDAFVWRLDFTVMERLLHSFFTTELWTVVEQPSSLHDLHFLKASESNALAPDAVRRVEAAVGAHVHLHHRQGGHWIHAESSGVVSELIITHLP